MIQLGDIYRIKMYPIDGITPKKTDTYRYKYIIILGHDGKNFCRTVAITILNFFLPQIQNFCCGTVLNHFILSPQYVLRLHLLQNLPIHTSSN
jgi:hypothetical protein